MFNSLPFHGPQIRSIIFVFFLVTACAETEPLYLEKVAYTSETLEKCKDTACPLIDISYLQAVGNTPTAQVINQSVKSHLLEAMNMNQEVPPPSTIDQAIDHIIVSFREFKTDFPQSETAYEISSTTTVSFESDSFLSLAVDTYTYWGGAHGYGSTTYLNFDKLTATPLTVDDMVTNLEAFTAEVEKRFRKEQSIPKEGSINSTGYFFEDDVFRLPENIGFEENQIILVYNSYEVASYADGQITLRIPYDEMKPYMAIAL